MYMYIDYIFSKHCACLASPQNQRLMEGGWHDDYRNKLPRNSNSKASHILPTDSMTSSITIHAPTLKPSDGSRNSITSHGHCMEDKARELIEERVIGPRVNIQSDCVDRLGLGQGYRQEQGAAA